MANSEQVIKQTKVGNGRRYRSLHRLPGLRGGMQG